MNRICLREGRLEPLDITLYVDDKTRLLLNEFAYALPEDRVERIIADVLAQACKELSEQEPVKSDG